MALEALRDIVHGAIERHGLCAAAAEHRVGAVPLGEPSVLVAASAAHRGEAFAGAREIIDAIKARAPIWKVEVDGGERRWVEGTVPGNGRPAGQAGRRRCVMIHPRAPPARHRPRLARDARAAPAHRRRRGVRRARRHGPAPRGLPAARVLRRRRATQAAAVAGFRVTHHLAWGRSLYVDDLSTLPGGAREGARRRAARPPHRGGRGAWDATSCTSTQASARRAGPPTAST